MYNNIFFLKSQIKSKTYIICIIDFFEYTKLKGDDFIKQIKLIFIGSSLYNYKKENIKIYDLDNNLILNTNLYNGEIRFLAQEKTFYKIKANIMNEEINKVFYVNNDDTYSFILNRIIIDKKINNKSITFLLTDKLYANLPIMNGEIILWQK